LSGNAQIRQNSTARGPVSAHYNSFTDSEEVHPVRKTSGVVRRFAEEVLNQGRIDFAERFFWGDMIEPLFLLPPVCQRASRASL
jgi:hypothetical protein